MTELAVKRFSKGAIITYLIRSKSNKKGIFIRERIHSHRIGTGVLG